MRDQAVRVELGISREVVAKMAQVSRDTLIRYELDPISIRDEIKRERIGRVYDELRAMLARYPALSA